jgi:hypothetical protein
MTESPTGFRPLRSRERIGDAGVAYALMRAAARLVGTLGGDPPNLRVSAGHPDESGCGAHECARHELPAGAVRKMPAAVARYTGYDSAPWME